MKDEWYASKSRVFSSGVGGTSKELIGERMNIGFTLVWSPQTTPNEC